MAVMDLEALWAALPDVIGDDAALDAVLRKIYRIPAWNGHTLGPIRATVTSYPLVVRNAEGVIVKVAELPQPKSWVELENERIAAQAARERDDFFESTRPAPYSPDGLRIIGPGDRDHPSNWARRDLEDTVSAIVAPRLDALEQQVAELRRLVESMQVSEVVA